MSVKHLSRNVHARVSIFLIENGRPLVRTNSIIIINFLLVILLQNVIVNSLRIVKSVYAFWKIRFCVSKEKKFLEVLKWDLVLGRAGGIIYHFHNIQARAFERMLRYIEERSSFAGG